MVAFLHFTAFDILNTPINTFRFFVKIHLLKNSRVVGFMLKKLLTYFEMLIVPHALQCVDGCFFAFYRI